MRKRLAVLSICFATLFAASCTQNGNVAGGSDLLSDNGAVSDTDEDSNPLTSVPAGISQVEHVDTTVEDGRTAGIELPDRVYSLSFPAYSENYDYYGYKEEKATFIEMSGSTADVTGDDADDVSVSEGLIKITGKGTYVLSGDFEGQIRAQTEDKNVRLVLNGVNITSPDGPAIWVTGAKNMYISLADGTENSISDSADYSDSEASAAITADCDLVINGNGKLNVCGNHSRAIHTKDDLILRSGSLEISSVGDAIKGKDSIKVYSGNYTIKAGGKGLSVTETEDAEKGYFYLEGGYMDITAGDDAIHCNGNVMIVGGETVIKAGDDGLHADKVVLLYDADVNIAECKEGIEGTVIDMTGSVVNVESSDDGLNAAGDTGENGADGDGMQQGGEAGNAENAIYMDGSNVYVNAGGDGMDSNGYIYLTGGNVVVDGPENSGNGIFDYGIDFIMTGGTLIGAGSSDMLQTVSESSSVTCIAVAAAGNEIVIKDGGGAETVSFEPKKSYNAVIFAGFGFENGETYTAYGDGTELGSVTVAGTVNYIGELHSFGAPGEPGSLPDFEQKPDFDGAQPKGEHPDFDGERPDKPETD